MELTWIQDFLALARSRSFCVAAQERNASQSAFSRHIKALEEWVGAPLFERTRHPVRLTEIGQAFLRTAEPSAVQLLEFRSSIRGRACGPSTITFLMTHAAPGGLLPGILEGLRQRSPLVLTRVLPRDLDQAATGMLEREAEFAFAYKHERTARPATLQQFSSITLATERFVPVCAAGHRGRSGYQVASRKSLQLLSFGTTSYLGRVIENELRRRGCSDYVRTVENPLACSLKGLALQGFGVAWLPHSLVAGDLAAGQLARAAPAEWEIPLLVEVFRQSQLNASGEAVWDLLGAMAHQQCIVHTTR